MSLGRARSVALIGVSGVPVDVEADVANGLPAIRLVGLADRAVSEAIDRVRSAVSNSGLPFPSQRVTISLSPASLPKSGSAFDLPIAIACLATSGLVPHERLRSSAFLGELALDGRLRPTAGILPATLAARSMGFHRMVVPHANAAEAELVSGIEVFGAVSLRDALRASGSTIEVGQLESIDHPACLGAESAAAAPEFDTSSAPDLCDVLGAHDAIEALVVAAAGSHNMFMVGPPGAGKTMLASRLPGILPPLLDEHALEVAMILSLTDGARRQVSLSNVPPFQAPHHSLSAAAMVGGGSAIVRPGVIVRAHRGVLFLDEAPEFATNVLDCLRQPLEAGRVSLQRAATSVDFPCDFQLVLAANPCPCGQSGRANDVACTCSPAARRRYLSRLSGPLMDRIDIQLTVPRATSVVRDEFSPVVTSADARSRVQGARTLSHERWGPLVNARVPGTTLRSRRFRPSLETSRALDSALQRGSITMRGYDRVLRLAWSLADLDGANVPHRDHLGRALFLRKGIST